MGGVGEGGVVGFVGGVLQRLGGAGDFVAGVGGLLLFGIGEGAVGRGLAEG